MKHTYSESQLNKRIFAAIICSMLLAVLFGCRQPDNAPVPSVEPTVQTTPTAFAAETHQGIDENGDEAVMKMRINGVPVTVQWDDNESTAALAELVKASPLDLEMSMYGGFEQVGSIGRSLPSSDVQTTARAGDIMLYSGDRIVVFYGSNSWAYTRLGRITDRTAEELSELLGSGDVTITLYFG